VRIQPNRTFSEPRKTITVAGITLDLVAAPGETDDQFYVWYPDKKVVFAGDNFYRSFPNIYPLRGIARRLTELVGGPTELLKRVEMAQQSGDYQWAAQLADHLLYLNKNAVAPKRIKADAFEALANPEFKEGLPGLK
jgi:alkyl sulfatase BDS1-like metallo-beta-lactamase superfamily hydrolase